MLNQHVGVVCVCAQLALRQGTQGLKENAFGSKCQKFVYVRVISDFFCILLLCCVLLLTHRPVISQDV